MAVYRKGCFVIDPLGQPFVESFPPKSSALKGIFLPVAFIVMWSSGAIFVELGLRFIQPLTFLSLRFIGATVLTWFVCLWFKPAFPKRIAEWGYILLTGLFLQGGYQVFFFLALAYNVSPGILTIILGVQPIFTAIIAREAANRNQWIGLIVGIIKGLSCALLKGPILNIIGNSKSAG